MANEEKPFRIQDRTFAFAVEIIQASKVMPRDLAGQVIVKQLVRSGTSIGANTEEADGAESKADFLHKMGIALKEAQETRYWLKLLTASYPALAHQITPLMNECDQLVRIISTIIRKGKNH